MSKKKKNLILGIIIIILTIVISLGIYFVGNKLNNSEYLTELTYETLKEKIDNKDSFVLVVTQTGCSHCEDYHPTLVRVTNKYKINIYTINRKELSDEGRSYLKEVCSISGTPTTVFIHDGEEKTTTTRLVGSVKEYTLIDRLKSEGFLNE
jgi:predicted bacteriocin transport accessory protein